MGGVEELRVLGEASGAGAPVQDCAGRGRGRVGERGRGLQSKEGQGEWGKGREEEKTVRYGESMHEEN